MLEKFTIIIPTRDRAETLAATIKTCLRQRYENLEIIVSDNVSLDNTKAVVDGFASPRLRYINPGHRLSMAGHFDFALGHATDGFVMCIGSDDGVMPDGVAYASALASRHGVDAVSCRQASYVWPNFMDQSIAGRLSFGQLRDDVEIRNSKEWIERTLNFKAPYCFDLPNLYCGFVHKRVLDKAYKDGRYFNSITPDAYAAFATAISVERYAFSHKSFVIAGASSKSNGASAMHPVGAGEEFKKFNVENDIEFSTGYVNCPSFEIAAGEAFAKLAEMFPERCAPYKVNHAAMLKGALDNANERTRDEVKAAVAQMAVYFSVDLAAPVPVIPKVKRGQMGRPTLGESVHGYVAGLRTPRGIEIERSWDLGIQDVDDAALVAHVLSQGFNAEQITTTRSTLTKRLKRKIGF
jgi:glycosyltransferase involved in cell wall biosynthesis